MKIYDPYYVIDPTHPVPPPVQGRTHSGKFRSSSSLSNPDFPASIPVDASWWMNGYLTAEAELERWTGNVTRIILGIFGTTKLTHFSWRMLFELMDCARDVARTRPHDFDGMITAAHAWLAEKQYDTARALLKKEFGDLAPQKLPDFQVNEILSRFFEENWDIIPEVSFP